MRKFFFSLTAAACAVCFATETQAQYSPYAAAPQARMQSLPPTTVTQGRYTPSAQVAGGYNTAGQTYGVQPASVAMRPGTTTYAAAPSAGGLRPVNPPSAQTQRLLMASRTTPTPAPAQVSQAAPRQAAPAGPPQQYWNSSVNSLPWDQSNGASYGAPGAQGPQPDPNLGGGGGPAAGGYAGGGECCNSGGGAACGGGCCCGLGRHCCLRTTGDLVQHMPHFGTTHGYYYFRPYHVMHVFAQQELATRWGGDPVGNPYDNTMFQQIYQQMGVDAATQKARDAANAKANTIQNSPPPVQEYIVPTPMPGAGYQQPGSGYQQQGVPQYVPGSDVPQGALPPGVVPQGIMPGPTPGPAVEYVPNR